MEITQGDVVLCEFYFSDLKSSKKRPVLVLKDNLPYNDFVAMAISSKIDKLQADEMIIENSDFEYGDIPQKSKLMIRKTFVVSKISVLKKYGSVHKDSFAKYHENFCLYFDCVRVLD